MKQQQRVKKFVEERGWQPYHVPKELLLGMVEEIGEFRNLIKWEQDEEKIRHKLKDKFDEVEDFFGDIMTELCSLANYCGVNIEKALEETLEKHKRRYPVDKFKGKYEE